MKNALTATSYENVNATNSNPQPYTATGMDSDAQFRGPHTVPTPANPMKGGYLHKSNRRKHNRKSKKTSLSSLFGTAFSPARANVGGKRRRKSSRFSKRYRSMGMTLARGRSGGSHRRRSHRRRRRGGMGGMNQGFPTGYATPAPLNPNLNLSAMANPPTYLPNYSS
jgi:hypothetical protein